MSQLTTAELTHLLTTYGYWAVLFFVAIESIGIPFPGETMLLVAAIYAGRTHHLFIPLVIVAAATGAILGDNIGFWIGREGAIGSCVAIGAICTSKRARSNWGNICFSSMAAKWSSSGVLSLSCVPLLLFWPGPTGCPGPGFSCLMPWEESCGQRSMDWVGIFSATTFIGLEEQSAPSRLCWRRSSSSAFWSSCAAMSSAWKKRQRKLCLVHLRGTSDNCSDNL